MLCYVCELALRFLLDLKRTEANRNTLIITQKNAEVFQNKSIVVGAKYG